MKVFQVTYLWWQWEGQTKEVVARNPVAAAGKAFPSARRGGYSWVEGVEHKCLQTSGMLCDAAAKVVEKDTGNVSWLHLYEWG